MDYKEYISQRVVSDETTRAKLFDKAKELENEDRRCFSQTRDGWEVAGREDLCQHPHKSLVPLFDVSSGLANKDAFSIEAPTPDDANREKRVFFLNRKEREQKSGKLSVVPTLNDFRSTFLDVFCEGQLRYLNWDNVFAAGGGILACAQPIPPEHAASTTTKRSYFHDLQYGASDVDLFLYGLNEEQAKKKLVEIYRAVCESNPHTVVCFRSAHAVTLVSQYPFRHIQIVLRLYSSPYEVLAGFDVDACTVGFDGKMVYADVRAHHALVTCRNTIDVTRRSPSYEMRLAKYGVRGFEVEVKDLKRDMIDPGIFERPWNSLDGLAKLIVLERLRTPEQRTQFFEMQKLNRGGMGGYRRHQRAYDSATQERIEEKLGGTAEVSNYSTVFLPWGPGQSTESTMRLMAKKDQKLNSPWFMRDRPYRLHPCFFGTAEEILQDCSKDDPLFPPKKEGEDAKMREHRETYVRGPLQFIADDPGRQRIGSFHPLSEAGWSDGVYFHPSTEELFASTNANDVAKVKSALDFCVKGPDVRDFFGRTALHLALMAGSLKAAKALLEAEASPLEPMAGGRTVFHLAAIYDHHEFIPVLKEYTEKKFSSQLQEELAKEAGGAGGSDVVMATTTTTTGEDSDQKLQKKLKASVRQLIRARDGDAKLSALQLALVLGNLKAARALLKAGATPQFDDTKLKDGTYASQGLIELLPTDQLDEGVKLLVEFGFSAAERYPAEVARGCTPLLALVTGGDVLAVEAVLKYDPTATKALSMASGNGETPLRSAIQQGSSADIVNVLLQYKPVVLTLTSELVKEAQVFDPNNWFLNNFRGVAPSEFMAVRCVVDSLVGAVGIWCNVSGQDGYRSYHNGLTVSRKQKQQKKDDDSTDTIVQQLLSKDYEDMEERNVRVAEMVALHADLNALCPSPLIDWQLTRQPHALVTWDYKYWRQQQKLADGQPDPAISVSDYCAHWVGKIEHLLETSLDESARKGPIDINKLSPATVVAICLELEAELKAVPHLQTAVRGWRCALEAARANSIEDVWSGLTPEITKTLDKLFKERMERLKSRLDRLKKAFKCPSKLVTYSRDSWKNESSSSSGRGNRFGSGWNANGPNAIDASGNPFPSCSDLFFMKENDTEKDVRAFLSAMEKRYPVPSPFPQNLKKGDVQDPWVLAALQRSLFRLAARSYQSLSVRGATTQRNDWLPLEFPKLTPGRVLGLAKADQERCALLFAQCRRGVTDDLERICKDAIAVTIEDTEGNTPLTMAVLSGNPECAKEVIRLCEAQLVKPHKPKKGAAPARIDNFELMQELEEENSDDDEEEEEEEDDDEDEDDDEGEDDDDSQPKKKKAAVVQAKPGESTVKPHELFCLSATLFLDSSPIYSKLVEYREQIQERMSKATAMDSASMTHFTLTPVQLAIVLGDFKMLETLLDEAMRISPNLLRSVLLHGSTGAMRERVGYTITLAIMLDQPEMLRLIMSKYAIALPFEVISSHLQVDPWKFTVDVDAAGQANQNKKGNNKRSRYEGLQSVLFGATKKREEMKRDPRLTSIERIPYPRLSLLHIAAGSGASKCFEAIRNGFRKELEALVVLPTFASVKEMLDKVRERTPKAFVTMSDVDIIEYYLLGRDDSVPDFNNRTVLHYSVAENTLEKLLKDGVQFSPKLLSRSYEEVSLEDRIRFEPVTDSALGEFTFGGSPLSLACVLDYKEVALLLIDQLGFNPNQKDAYFFGMNAFHLALCEKTWSVAKAIGERMDPGKLLEPNEWGITPLMTAARAGTVEGLMAAVAHCATSPTKDVPISAMQKDQEGRLALHFAADARFPETLRKIMDWTVEQSASQWLAEEYASGRTALESAVAVVINSEMNAATNREAREKSLRTFEKLKKHGHISAEELAYVEKFTNGRAMVSMMAKAAAGQPRIRATFPQVRPAREKRLEAVASVDVSTNAVAKGREDFRTVWPRSGYSIVHDRASFCEQTSVSTPLELLACISNNGSNLSLMLW